MRTSAPSRRIGVTFRGGPPPRRGTLLLPPRRGNRTREPCASVVARLVVEEVELDLVVRRVHTRPESTAFVG